MVKLVLPCGEVCCEFFFFVMTVSCPTEFGEAQFRVFVSKNILIHQNAAILLISATSGEAMFTSLQAWHAGVAGMWCGSCVRCVTFLFVHGCNSLHVLLMSELFLQDPTKGR